MLSMCKISTMQDILQWLHCEEFPDDIAKLQSGPYYKEQGHRRNCTYVKRSSPLK